MCIIIEKLFETVYIIFEINIFIEMVIVWLLAVKVIIDKEKPKFL